MYSKEPVWLLPEDIVRKYDDFCFYNNITERRIIKLFDAFLLRGRDNRKTKNVEILQESFEELQNHVIYNFLKQGSRNENEIKIPEYLKYKYRIFYDSGKNWYTPKEILETYSAYLKYERNFTTDFIGELTQIGLITGKYQPSEHCYYVLLRSFVWLMKYREHIVKQYLILPPS